MSTKSILQAVKEGTITAKEGLRLSEKKSTQLGNIVPKFDSQALECGFPSMEAHQYIMKDESNLIVMAARPGNGKTALACQIALNVSAHGRVLMFSLEMRKESLYKRLLSVVSQVPIKQLGNPKHTDRVIAATANLATRNFSIIDSEELNVNQIIQMTHDENNYEKLDIVIIDYVGLIKVNPTFRAVEIGAAAKAIKQRIANELKIPVLLIAQMNRNFEDRYSQYLMAVEKAKLYPNASERELAEVRPNMSDLAESSGIEHCTDVAMFLHRPHLLDKSKPSTLFRVFVAKNRNGVVKDFNLDFSDSQTTFYDNGGHLTGENDHDV